jgi:hypothetical protein
VGEIVAFLVKAEAYCGAVEQLQIAGDTLLDLRHAPLYLLLVKFLSRLFTALNLLPSIATVASVNHWRG